MPTPQRRRHTGVIADLLENPHRFDFFQAVRMLELWFQKRNSGRPGEALATKIRFLNSPSLAFPASEIAGLAAYGADGVLLADSEAQRRAIEDGSLSRVDLTPAFFGLLGGQGALPLHYTETLAARETNRRDRAARAFFDIFSNRAAALFYSAWKKYRLPLRHESDRDHHYLPLLLSLAGLGHPALRDRLHAGGGEIFDESVAHYAAAVRQRPVSAFYLQRVLSDYFHTAIRIEQFVGKWYTVPPEHRTRLGSPQAILGVSAQAGERIWQRDLCMRLWLGPLTRQAFGDFLPGGERALALAKMLMLLAGPGFEYEVRLILLAADVGGSSLQAANGVSLGHDTFLCTEPASENRSDASYVLQTLH